MQPTSQSDPNLAGARPRGRATGARLGGSRPRRASGRFANLILMIIFGPSTLLLWAMIYLGLNQCHWMQAQVDAKQAQLTAFTRQYEVGQRRLIALRSNKGNEEILIENGYIPPGDRILLFPATPAEQRKAATAPNDLSPHEPLIGAAPPTATASSVWRSAGDVLHNWWGALRVAAGGKAGAKPPGAKSAGATAPPEASGGDASETATATPFAVAAPETDSPHANSASARPSNSLSVSPAVNGSGEERADTASSASSSAESAATARSTEAPSERRHHTLSVESDATVRP